jgi:pimeloyl-ACP methyl ester carboxylesterase
MMPSMPGFAFSDQLARQLGPRATADLVNGLLTEVLGYDQYLLHGGDWGAIVADWTAIRHPNHVAGLHLNLGFTRHDGAAFGSGETGPGTATPDEHEWASAEKAAVESEFAYFQLQASDPLTVSYALTDSPVGLAAWIVDKFLLWADSRIQARESVFDFDTLLTEVMLYLVTDTFYTATRCTRRSSKKGRPPCPRANSSKSRRTSPPSPTRTAHLHSAASSKRSHNIVAWTDMPRGGHFPALEEPRLLVGDLRQFVASTAK